MKLALTHDAEGGAFGSIDGDVEAYPPRGGFAFEGDVLEVDVAVGSEKRPGLFDLFLDGLEALVSDVGGGGSDPVFSSFEMFDGLGLGLMLLG